MARKCTRWGRSNGRKVCRKYSGSKRKSTRRKGTSRGRCQTVTIKGSRRKICRNARGQITSSRTVRRTKRRR